MSLQFDVEEFIRPLVSALYESSDEDMEIDTVSTTVVNRSLDDDSDIEVLACYREAPIYPPQLTAGRAMTFDLPIGEEDQDYLQCGPSGSIGSTFDPSDGLDLSEKQITLVRSLEEYISVYNITPTNN